VSDSISIGIKPVEVDTNNRGLLTFSTGELLLWSKQLVPSIQLRSSTLLKSSAILGLSALLVLGSLTLLIAAGSSIVESVLRISSTICVNHKLFRLLKYFVMPFINV